MVQPGRVLAGRCRLLVWLDWRRGGCCDLVDAWREVAAQAEGRRGGENAGQQHRGEKTDSLAGAEREAAAGRAEEKAGGEGQVAAQATAASAAPVVRR